MSELDVEAKSKDGLASEVSRRQWLLKLGEAAILLGFSASIEPETVAGPTTAPPATALRTLPPGLYEPSAGHLGHALGNVGRFVTLTPGSQTEYLRPRKEPWHPLFFSESEFQAIERLVKLILGPPAEKTSHDREDEFDQTVVDIAQWIDLTVSQAASVRDAAHRISVRGRALAVAYYGRENVEKLEIEEPERICREGLKWLDQTSMRLHGARFLGLKEAAQIEVARSTIAAGSPDQEGTGAKLMGYLTVQVVQGFYSSRFGLNEIGYRGNSFSVESPGCKPD
jgi:hypothetical protein